MSDVIHPEWINTLLNNQLAVFEALWKVDSPSVDEPNLRQSGWSRVSKLSLVLQDGNVQDVFLKRQCNYRTRSLVHPFKGLSTVYREINNIQRFDKQGITTLTPLFYGERENKEGSCALLLTIALDKFISLDALLLKMRERNNFSMEQKKQIIDKVAAYIRRVHDASFRHGCLYAKHVFVQIEKDGFIADVRLIDLEKARRWYFPQNRMMRDLSALYRSVGFVSTKDAMRFIQSYLGRTKLQPKDKKLVRKLYQRILRKQQ